MLYGDFFMNKIIQKYIRENISLLVTIGIIYLVGIAIGIIIYSFTNTGNEYAEVVRKIFDQTKQDNFVKINIISNGIRNNLVYIAILYFSLITVVAPIIVCMLIVVKAMVTGVYMCTIFSIFGTFKGILVNILNVIIPNIFSLMGYIIICINIIEIFKNITQSEKIDIKFMAKLVYCFIIALSLISFAIVFEQLTISTCLSIYNNIS